MSKTYEDEDFEDEGSSDGDGSGGGSSSEGSSPASGPASVTDGSAASESVLVHGMYPLYGRTDGEVPPPVPAPAPHPAPAPAPAPVPAALASALPAAPASAACEAPSPSTPAPTPAAAALAAPVLSNAPAPATSAVPPKPAAAPAEARIAAVAMGSAPHVPPTAWSAPASEPAAPDALPSYSLHDADLPGRAGPDRLSTAVLLGPRQHDPACSEQTASLIRDQLLLPQQTPAQSFEQVLTDVLDQSGTLGRLKAQVRFEVMQALNSKCEAKPPLSNENMLINALILEYLNYNCYNHTTSTLRAESGQPQEDL
eukprot:gene782-2535_t